MNFLKDRFLFITAAFSIFAITPLLRGEFFATHDMAAPVYRLLELDTCLKDGVLFPRWAPDLYGGRGGPLFNYYSPFAYYVAELFHLAGLGYINSIKACFLFSFVLSGVLMFILAKDRVGEYPALLAAVLYMYAPYHLFDVYVRGDITESFTFVLMPLVLYSFDRGRVVLGSLSYASLILAHNAIALLFTGFLFFYIVIFRKELLLSSAILIGLHGSLLSAFYWIPALFEKDLVYIQHALMFTPSENFTGVLDIPNKIGILPFLLAFGAVLISKERRTRILFVILIGLIFLMTRYSGFIWSSPFTSLFAYVQFPWRLLAIVTLIVSLLGGITASRIKSGRIILLLSFLVALSSVGHIGYFEYVPISESDITKEELKIKNTGLIYADHFFPKGAKMQDSIVKNDVEALEGGNIETIEKSCNSLSFEYIGGGELAKINYYYFPGWAAYIDGKKTALQTDEHGLTALEIPEGPHTANLKFEDTPVRRYSEILSLFAFMALALQTARGYRAASKSPVD